MGSWGALIMGFFGAVFAALTMHWQWRFAGAALALPFVGFAAIALGARHVIRLPGPGMTPSPRAERAIMWSSIGEGVGLFVAANIVINLHRPEWLLPAMALVVGGHFLPIAIAVPFRPFFGLAAALVLAGVIGFVLPAPLGGEISGLCAAFGLWAAAVLAVRRDWRFKLGTGRPDPTL